MKVQCPFFEVAGVKIGCEDLESYKIFPTFDV